MEALKHLLLVASACNRVQNTKVGHQLTDLAVADRAVRSAVGRYLVRFLPPTPGLWRFETTSNARSLDGIEGRLQVRPGSGRGPVSVADG